MINSFFIVVSPSFSIPENDINGSSVGATPAVGRRNRLINKNLASQLQSIYQKDFDPTTHIPDGKLSDICRYSTDRIAVSALTEETYYSTENMLPYKAGAVAATSLPSVPQTTKCHIGDVIVSNIRPYFQKIVYIAHECGCSTDVLCFVPKEMSTSIFLYATLYADRFFDYMVAGSKGTKMPRGDKHQVMQYPVVLPKHEQLADFNRTAIPMLTQMLHGDKENERLCMLRDSLLPRLISGELDVSDISL